MAKIKLKTGATIEETFQDFIISRRAKGLKEKTIESYQHHFHAVARHLDVEMDIDMLQKSDLDILKLFLENDFLVTMPPMAKPRWVN